MAAALRPTPFPGWLTAVLEEQPGNDQSHSCGDGGTRPGRRSRRGEPDRGA